MARFDYARMQGTASRLLNRFAQGEIILTRVTPGESDPETPWIPGEPTVETHTLDATVSAIMADQANAKFIDGTTITASDLVVTCAVPPIKPNVGDTLTIDGAAHTIIMVMQLPAAGVPVAFKMIVSGGGTMSSLSAPEEGPEEGPGDEEGQEEG